MIIYPIFTVQGDTSGRQFCVIFYLGPFFGCIFGPFLELEYLGLGGVETYDLFKIPFGAHLKPHVRGGHGIAKLKASLSCGLFHGQGTHAGGHHDSRGPRAEVLQWRGEAISETSS